MTGQEHGLGRDVRIKRGEGAGSRNSSPCGVHSRLRAVGRWKGAQLLWDDWGRGQGALLGSRWCCGWLAQVLGKISGAMKIEGQRAGPHGVMDTDNEWKEDGYSQKSAKILRQVKTVFDQH